MKMKWVLCGLVCCCWIGNTAAISLTPDLDFYTPMSQMIFSDRNYLLTSNAYAQFSINGSTVQSYETLLFMKFSHLPEKEVPGAWLRLASGAGGTMGESSRPVLISVHPVDRDIASMMDYSVTPKEFYVDHNHILPPADSIMVFRDGVCYWNITDIVNNWIRHQNTNGNEGYENLGLAVTGREDEEALNPYNNQHVGFWSSRAATLPHAALPALHIRDSKDAFDWPWIPEWNGNPAYTCQFWTLSAKSGKVQQGLAPDGYMDNPFGEPNAVWQEETLINGVLAINPFLTWHPFADSSDPNGQPAWVDGVYGGVYRAGTYLPHTLTAAVPTGSDQGVMTIVVQYDWYDAGAVEVNVPGSVDITPALICDYVIGGSGEHHWYRSTRIFEMNQNPGQIKVNFKVSGNEPYIDAFSVTTAVNAVLPQEPLRHDKDCNLDGMIDMTELGIMSHQWEQSGILMYADYSGNGIVNSTDLILFTELWLTSSPYRFVYDDE